MKNETPPAWDEVIGKHGRSTLAQFLLGDESVRAPIMSIVTATNAGQYDALLAGNPDPEAIHVTTSCHLMVLKVLHRLLSINATEFYKDDPLQYVRMNCLIQRMLGLERLTLGWPVYAFGAEILGQTMIYPQDQAPGSDPGAPLLNRHNLQELPEFDPEHPVIVIIRNNLRHMARLSGVEPVAHMPAPYSLAAEILGQESLICALATEPDFVRNFLDLIVERVLKPWCDDLVENIPNVWLEFSDASGSPMFVGPANFLTFAVDPVLRLIDEPHWGDRVFVANYRGDMPAGQPSRGRRRRQTADASSPSFETLLLAKKQCCPRFLMRLEADAAPVERYVDAAIELQLPLYLGIGAVLLDRNSVPNIEEARRELRQVAQTRASLIKQVSASMAVNGHPRNCAAWPGDLYIEDTNGETNIELIQAVLAGVHEVNHRR